MMMQQSIATLSKHTGILARQHNAAAVKSTVTIAVRALSSSLSNDKSKKLSSSYKYNDLEPIDLKKDNIISVRVCPDSLWL